MYVVTAMLSINHATICLLIHIVYSGAEKDYKISPYDLNKEK